MNTTEIFTIITVSNEQHKHSVNLFIKLLRTTTVTKISLKTLLFKERNKAISNG